MRKISCTTIAFILAFGLLVPTYFFEQAAAQGSPNPNSSSNTGTKVISTPSSSTPAPPIQLKTTIFADLAKCISTRTCRPIMGSEGDDRITGDNGSNVIMGLGGNDIIRGGTGDNIIIGGLGDNQLYGGGGNNIILASGTGTVQMYGGNGSNILIAGQGSTLLVAGKGNDKLYGGGGNDVFIGGPGADYFACANAGTNGGTSKSVVLNFNAAKGDDTDGTCGVVLGQ
jgi:RTX calcium-binding nonapeptide repeat (4 copies)